jgi:hypothetical protein
MESERLSARFRESTSNGEVDGSATLEGFLQAFVETLVGGSRLGNKTRKGKLANDNLAVGARESSIAMTERVVIQRYPVLALGSATSGMFDRITDTLAVDVQVAIYSPRLMFLTYYYNFHTVYFLPFLAADATST